MAIEGDELPVGGFDPAVLTAAWALKARVEERLLAARYPGYAEYCERTRYRLCPFGY